MLASLTTDLESPSFFTSVGTTTSTAGLACLPSFSSSVSHICSVVREILKFGSPRSLFRNATKSLIRGSAARPPGARSETHALSLSMASARTFQLPRSCSALTVSEGTNPNSMAPLITAAMTRSPPGGSARSNPAPATSTRGGAKNSRAPSAAGSNPFSGGAIREFRPRRLPERRPYRAARWGLPTFRGPLLGRTKARPVRGWCGRPGAPLPYNMPACRSPSWRRFFA